MIAETKEKLQSMWLQDGTDHLKLFFNAKTTTPNATCGASDASCTSFTSFTITMKNNQSTIDTHLKERHAIRSLQMSTVKTTIKS